MPLFLQRKLLLIVLCLISTTSLVRAADVHPLLEALATENHFALLRHALAPGTGDPADFDVADCTTQRNLNETGRTQAVNIGQTLRDSGIDQALVFSSQWCRCQDTASLLGFDTATDNPILNSFFRNRDRSELQTLALEQWLSDMTLKTPTILVTHQVNISAFAGVYASSGDMVIIKRNEDATFTALGIVPTAP
ncbi:MAG: phosphohistidine phosphatase SixA [bacterium]|jgi:phosphohistidine phosphatase SixA